MERLYQRKLLMRVCTVLTVFVTAALLLTHFALTDVHQGGEDPRAEWLMVALAVGIMLVFVGAAGLLLTWLRTHLHNSKNTSVPQ